MPYYSKQSLILTNGSSRQFSWKKCSLTSYYLYKMDNKCFCGICANDVLCFKYKKSFYLEFSDVAMAKISAKAYNLYLKRF